MPRTILLLPLLLFFLLVSESSGRCSDAVWDENHRCTHRATQALKGKTPVRIFTQPEKSTTHPPTHPPNRQRVVCQVEGSVGTCSLCTHVFARPCADLHAQSVLANKISASELSRKSIKSALLVGTISLPICNKIHPVSFTQDTCAAYHALVDCLEPLKDCARRKYREFHQNYRRARPVGCTEK